MINDSMVDFYNSRISIDYTKLKDLTPQQKDKIRSYGSQAESLLKNKDVAMFVHHWKFEVNDNISGIRGHSIDDNAQRIAYANELVGMDSFINSLKRAVYLKNKLGNTDIDAQVE